MMVHGTSNVAPEGVPTETSMQTLSTESHAQSYASSTQHRVSEQVYGSVPSTAVGRPSIVSDEGPEEKRMTSSETTPELVNKAWPVEAVVTAEPQAVEEESVGISRAREVEAGEKEADMIASNAAITYPEGGLRAWLVVAGSFWCSFFTWGYCNAFGVFVEYYLAHNLSQKSASDVAWIGSLQYCLIFLMGVFTGRLFDLGFFKPVMLFGIFLFVFSQMMTSLSTQYYQLILAQGIGCGAAYGIIFCMAVAVPAHWFNARRGLAYGVVAAGSSIGGVIFPVMTQKLIPMIGFPWTVRLIGFMALVLLVFAWLVMDTRLPPLALTTNRGWRTTDLFDVSAFRQAPYTLFVIGVTVILFGLYTPFTYINVFTSQYSVPAAEYMLSILNGASLFGRTIPGALSDRWGKINTIIPHVYMCVILIILFPLCTNLGGMVAFSIIFGYCSGCYVSLIPTGVAQLGSTKDVGTRLGMMFGCMSLSGLLGTPISGAILGTGDDLAWWPTMICAGACVLAGTIFIHASRQVHLRTWGWRGII